jgi:CRP-like cAMP-binding protein
VFFAADPVTTLFAVVEGGVDLIRTQPDGRRVVLQRARDDQVLAEASLYSERYHCDAVVMRRTQCLAVDVETFRRAVAEDDALRRTWDAHLARELMRARQLTELLSRRTVRDRLDGWLQLHENVLPAKGTRTELADQLGVSNEALYREIARRGLR